MSLTSHKDHDSSVRERGLEEAVGSAECLLVKHEGSLSGDLYGLVTVAGLTHAQWTGAHQGQMPHLL